MRIKSGLLVILLVSFFVSGIFVPEAAAANLKYGSKGDSVKQLQTILKQKGYPLTVDGHFGKLTKAAVQDFQKNSGLMVDGIVGNNTWSKLYELRIKISSRTDSQFSSKGDYLPWAEASKLYERGKIATITDIETGLSYKVIRTGGTNHADSKPLTDSDTAIMKKIYGGSWSWARRAIIVTVDGRNIAASQNGMPHTGYNGKIIEGNGFKGSYHFCIHFLNSKTHGSNRLDPSHQSAVKKAAGMEI